MTTTTQQAPRTGGPRVLVGAGVAALLVGAAVVLAGRLVTGSDAAYGAAVGAGITAAVFFLGGLVVNLVASVLPTASLLVALLTYVLQVVLMAVVLAALSDTALFAERTPRVWLAGGVIACTGAWVVAQIWLTTRLRVLAYDLPAEGAGQGRTGGER